MALVQTSPDKLIERIKSLSAEVRVVERDGRRFAFICPLYHRFRALTGHRYMSHRILYKFARVFVVANDFIAIG